MNSLPLGWIEAQLDKLAEVRLGRQRSPKNHAGSRMRPYLRAGNVTWRGLDLTDIKEMNFSEQESDVYELYPGDVLVAEASGSAGEVGKPAVWRGEIDGCCFQNTLVRVRSFGPLPEYLRYFLLAEARSGRLGDAAPGVGIHHIGSARLSAWSVPVPPLSEQQRIVDVIEEQFSRLDVAERCLDAAALKVQSLRRAALAKAFDGPWPRALLGEIASVDSGPAFKSEFFGGPSDGIRLLRGENIEPGRLRWRDTRTWPESKLSGYEHLFVSEADVILAMDRPVISTGLKLAPVRENDLPALLVQRVARIRPSERVLTPFLRLVLQLPRFVPHLLGDQTGTQLPHITLAGIRAFEVPLPPLDEQLRVVAEVDQVLSVIDTAGDATESAKLRGNALRQAILARAFRGELVPQDPDEEPASLLLERIAAERAAATPTRRRRVPA